MRRMTRPLATLILLLALVACAGPPNGTASGSTAAKPQNSTTQTPVLGGY